MQYCNVWQNLIDFEQPVSHKGHGWGGLPEGLDDSGVADDHDDAGDQECDHQLIESEVDPDMEDDAHERQAMTITYPMLSSVSLQ